MHLVRKNDGVVIQTLHVGGSHLNDFEIISTEKGEFLIFGGELSELIVYKYSDGFLTKNSRICTERLPAYGEVTSLAVAPDQ